MTRPRRARGHRLGRRRTGLVGRTALLAAALLLLTALGTALTASVAGLPPVAADAESTPWPAYALGSGPTYSTADGLTTATLTVAPAAGQVRARMDSTDWRACTTGDAGTTWSCVVAGETGTFSWLATP